MLTIPSVPAPARKHPNQYTYRAKSGTGGQSRRAPQSGGGQKEGSTATHDHGTRRNANSGNSGASGAGGRNHSAYYNNLQLPMFTSWGLPDYLAHLQSILPSDVPPPLQIRGATSFFRDDLRHASSTQDENASVANGVNGMTEDGEAQAALTPDDLAGATESLTERGVKVKWPAKRMSVSDMNKRVRALVEWVGREQALAHDRERRKAALEEASAKEQPAVNNSTEDQPTVVVEAKTVVVNGTADIAAPSNNKEKVVNGVKASAEASDDKMVLDGVVVESSTSTKSTVTATAAQGGATVLTATAAAANGITPSPAVTTQNRVSTTRVMEELMEELISFQERFGPGAKTVARERDRHARIAIFS